MALLVDSSAIVAVSSALFLLASSRTSFPFAISSTFCPSVAPSTSMPLSRNLSITASRNTSSPWLGFSTTSALCSRASIFSLDVSIFFCATNVASRAFLYAASAFLRIALSTGSDFIASRSSNPLADLVSADTVACVG